MFFLASEFRRELQLSARSSQGVSGRLCKQTQKPLSSTDLDSQFAWQYDFIVLMADLSCEKIGRLLARRLGKTPRSFSIITIVRLEFLRSNSR